MMYYKEIKNPNSTEWVVFLHGLCANSAMWSKQIFAFKQKYNLLLIDLPSHGNSEKVITEKNVTTMEEIASIIVEILDSLKIQKAHFAGVSIGTLVVAKIYQLFPNKVQSIVMCGAVASFGIFQEFMVNVLKFSARLFNPRTMAKIWVDQILDKKERAGIRDLFMEQSKHISKHDTMRWLQLCAREHKLLYKLDYNNLNILIVMGSRDKLFLTPIKKLKEKFANIKLEIIPDSGHICNSHTPEIFNKLSLDFLSKI